MASFIFAGWSIVGARDLESSSVGDSNPLFAEESGRSSSLSTYVAKSPSEDFELVFTESSWDVASGEAEPSTLVTEALLESSICGDMRS